MLRKPARRYLLALLFLIFISFTFVPKVFAWGNGGYSDEPSNPKYSTHDWIAEHAKNWLPPAERKWIDDNLNYFLYGTEYPDNSGASYGTTSGYGDTVKHHNYYGSDGSVTDASAANRAKSEYDKALAELKAGRNVTAAIYAGSMTHYIDDVAVFGHVMTGKTHHSDYEDYVGTRTSSYDYGVLESYIVFDGELENFSAYDASINLGRNTFNDNGGTYTANWMDTHYDWSNTAFKNRCGESLNLATNYVADVLHTLVVAAFGTAITTTKSSSQISCSASSSSIIINQNITISGFITPSHLSVTVVLTYTKPDGSNISRATTTNSTSGYRDVYTPNQTGSWKAKAKWDGDNDHDGASSSVSFTVSKISSTISCSVSSTSVSIGSSLIVSGSITPVRSGVTVTLSYTMPNATVLMKIVTSASDGKYGDTYTPPVLGSWSVKASWEGDSAYAGAMSSSVSFTVSKIFSSISCSVSSSSPTIGDSATVSGSITPARSGVTVTISYKSDGSFSTLSTVTTASDGSYSYSWKPASVGSYHLKASWAGDSTYNGATSDAVSVTVNKISSSISCTASSSDITDGDSIMVSGSISPAVSGKTVTLTYTKPDGKTTVTRTVTTGSDSSYSDSYKPDATGSWSVKVAWDGDSEHTSASSHSATFNVKKKGCIIATSTYGSELSSEAQFLREFRDNKVLNTFAGSNFMAVFNVFYYSFSPSVASTISGNEVLRDAMKVILYPLIGMLHLSSVVFSLFSFSPELGVVMAGLVASSLIAVVYVMPWVLLFSFFKKLRPSTKSIRLTGLVWAGSVVAMVLAEVATSSPLMMASTGAFVLATIFLTTLASTRAVTKRYIRATR